jgi:hypothetical protein
MNWKYMIKAYIYLNLNSYAPDYGLILIITIDKYLIFYLKLISNNKNRERL